MKFNPYNKPESDLGNFETKKNNIFIKIRSEHPESMKFSSPRLYFSMVICFSLAIFALQVKLGELFLVFLQSLNGELNIFSVSPRIFYHLAYPFVCFIPLPLCMLISFLYSASGKSFGYYVYYFLMLWYVFIFLVYCLLLSNRGFHKDYFFGVSVSGGVLLVMYIFQELIKVRIEKAKHNS